NIGTPASRDALFAAPASPAVTDALLAVAERSYPESAAMIYRRLGPDGLAGLARLEPAQALPLLRAALKGDSLRTQAIAIRESARIEGVALARDLPNVSERAQIQILAALSDSGRPEVRPVLIEAAASRSEAVR